MPVLAENNQVSSSPRAAVTQQPRTSGGPHNMPGLTDVAPAAAAVAIGVSRGISARNLVRKPSSQNLDERDSEEVTVITDVDSLDLDPPLPPPTVTANAPQPDKRTSIKKRPSELFISLVGGTKQ